MGLFNISGQGSLGEKETAVRIEKLQRNFTWAVIIFVLIVHRLPLGLDTPYRMLYILVFCVAAFTFFWYHFLPKKFSGQLKNLIYSLLTIFFVGFLVHWTGGVKSFALFFYALAALSVAISMGLLTLLLFLSLIGASLFFQAFLAFGTVNFVTDLSLSIFWLWGISMIALYGRMLSSQLTLAKIEEKKAEIEKAKEIDRLQDEFIFFISYKLQLPISALADYLTKMSELAATKKIKDISMQLWQASLKLARLVDLFLDVARIESGRLPFNLQAVDLPQCIKTVIETFEPLAQTRNIKISYQGPERISTKVDQDRLCEVLTNLIDNAIKFSQEETSVTLAVERKDGKVITSVTDQAGGIPPEAQEHIFEKYYRVKEGGKVPGTGLGLYFSKQLVEKQEGKIWFETRQGEGTTFSFSLPLSKK